MWLLTVLSKLSQAIKSAVDCQGRELSLQIDGLAQDYRDEKVMREQESIGEFSAFVETALD